jgi:xylose isomerase
MAFALSHNKLASVHLNDQNGLKFDQDKSFGGANLRSAYNQVRVLEEAGYGRRGEFIGLDVKAMRTQRQDQATKHLTNSREIFLHLVEKVRTADKKLEQQFIEARDYEALEAYTLRHLMGVPEAKTQAAKPLLAKSGARYGGLFVPVCNLRHRVKTNRWREYGG